MSWQSLGQVAPTNDWQSLPVDSVGAVRLFKVIHTFNGDYVGSAHATIASYFPSEGRCLFIKSYPSKTATILAYPLPDAFLEAGLAVRTLQIRQNLFGRVYASANWQIEVQEWNGPVTPVNQQISGGVYPWS